MVVIVGVTTKEATPEASNGPLQGVEPLYQLAKEPAPPPPVAVSVVNVPTHIGESGFAVKVGSPGTWITVTVTETQLEFAQGALSDLTQ